MPSFSDPSDGLAAVSVAAVETAAGRLAFYGEHSTEAPAFRHTAEDLAGYAAANGDPFGGRHDPAHPVAAIVQVSSDQRIYWALSAADLQAMAAATARLWERLGIGPGQRIVLYDYATAPPVLFASRSFVPHLEVGAADMLGCVPICNDGLPELADRCVHAFEYVAPHVAFVDVQLMEPLLRAIAERPKARRPALVVVSGDEAPVPPSVLDDWARRMESNVVQLLRADGPLLMAPPCSVEPMSFHPDPATYVVEVGAPRDGGDGSAGSILVTNAALGSSVVLRYETTLVGRIDLAPCACGAPGPKVVILDDI